LDEIWNIVSQMWGLALADFGHNLYSRDSLRGIVLKNAKIAIKNSRSCDFRLS